MTGSSKLLFKQFLSLNLYLKNNPTPMNVMLIIKFITATGVKFFLDL